MKRWRFWLGILVSVVLLLFALRKVDLAAAWQAALSARWGCLAIAWLCLLVSYGMRSWRWRVILWAFQPLPLWTLWRVFMIGSMANNVLPARAGEVVRAYLLGRATQVHGGSAASSDNNRTASALGTIAVERVFDVLMALLLLVAGTAFGLLGGADRAGQGSVWLGAVAAGGLLAGVVALALWGDRLVDWGARLVGRAPATRWTSWGKSLSDVGRSFVQGLRAVGNMRRIAYVLFWSAASWALFMAYAHLVLCAYGLRVDLVGVAFLLGLAGMGVAIPSAPGSVGTLEYATILGLQWLGVGDENTRASFALTYHAIEWVTTCAIGLLCLGQLGLSIAQISAMVEGGGGKGAKGKRGKGEEGKGEGGEGGAVSIWG